LHWSYAGTSCQSGLWLTRGTSATLSLAPQHALAHLGLGRVQIFTNRAAQGTAECERALLLDRNLADVHVMIGVAEYIVGRGEKTEAHIKEAPRLSPRDTNAYLWMAVAGIAKLFLHSDEEAISWLRRSIKTNRNYPLAHFCLAAALAHVGRHNEARAATEAGLALNPIFTISRFLAAAPSDNPTFLTQRERINQGMRMAGVPEE
jgi:tetratricopeptide (TPR) repeat protein